jgi:hypothetical protein
MENIAFNIALEEIDDHFTEKLNESLNKIREQLHSSHENTPKLCIQNIHRSNDSPLTMSSNSDSDDITLKTADIYTEKLNVLDTLNVYFRCQKYMYDQSSKNTMYKHNCVSGITISITSSICVFISFIEMYQWRTVIIVVLNAIVSILLLLSKYWKLEITAELYSYISRQFELISENIEHMQPFNNSAISPHQMHNKIRELEKRVVETRDIPNITVPTYIQVLYPVSANINMFSFIKKVDARIAYLNDELHNINMEMKYVVKKYFNNMGPRETNRMQFLLNKKTTNKCDLKYAEGAYAYLEEIFTRELNKTEYYRNNYFYLYGYFTEPPQFVIDHSRCNPFVDEYISFILPNKNV